jgi:hypothetical protein
MRLLREAAKTRKETSKAKVQHQVQHKTRQDKTRDKTTPNRNRPQLTTQPTRDKQTKINGCKVFEETDALNGQGFVWRQNPQIGRHEFYWLIPCFIEW